MIAAGDGGLKVTVELFPERGGGFSSIGQFDSMSEQEKLAVEQLQQTVPEKICGPPECKDDTKCLGAIKPGSAVVYRFPYFYGYCGRFDHTLANIQCLVPNPKNHCAAGYLVAGYGMVLGLKNEAVHFREGARYLCIYILMIVKIQFYHLYTNLNQRFQVTLEDNIVLLKLCINSKYIL